MTYGFETKVAGRICQAELYKCKAGFDKTRFAAGLRSPEKSRRAENWSEPHQKNRGERRIGSSVARKSEVSGELGRALPEKSK
jgi:hypothetical protein